MNRLVFGIIILSSFLLAPYSLHAQVAGHCSKPGFTTKFVCDSQPGAVWIEGDTTRCVVGQKDYGDISFQDCETLKQMVKSQANSITKNPQAQAATQNNNQYFKGSSIPEYIKSIYTYAIGVVGILATVVIMIGGLIWISSMGNAARVNSAKEWIGAALTGLALAMFSYTILYIINPDTVNFRWTAPQSVNTTANTQNSAPKYGCYIVPASNKCGSWAVTKNNPAPSGFKPGGKCSSDLSECLPAQQ